MCENRVHVCYYDGRFHRCAKLWDSPRYGNNYCEYLSSRGHESVVYILTRASMRNICIYVYRYTYIHTISWNRSSTEDSAVFISQTRSAFAKFYDC